MQPMTEDEFLYQVRQAYIQAAKTSMPGEGIFRHRLRSTSGVQEDIVAYYIPSQDECLQVHIDQPISFRLPDGPERPAAKGPRKRVLTKKTWYPDIVVIKRHASIEDDGTVGTVIALVDVKTDLGWKRSDETFADVCDSLLAIRAGLWERRHLPLLMPIPALSRRRKNPAAAKSALIPNFDVSKLRCSERMTCHVVVVTANNSGNIADEGNARNEIAEIKDVHLHVLMTLHPNAQVKDRAEAPQAVEAGMTIQNDLAAQSLRRKDFESLKAAIRTST